MKTLRYGLEAFLLCVLSLLFRLMPLDIASSIGGWVGRSIGPRLAASRKALRNIQAAMPDLSEEEARAHITGMWDNLGRVIAEYPHLRYIARNRVQFKGADIMNALLDRSKGVMFVSGHLANWEVGPATLYEQFGLKVNAMYRAPNNPWTDKILTYFRTLGGVIPTLTKSRAGGQGAMKALKRGEALGILIDQKYNQGERVPFFGMDAMTNPIAPKFAQKFSAAIMPYSVKRLGGAHFEIRCYDEIPAQDRADIDALNDIHALLEGWITESPAQWLWLHRRWTVDAFKDV